MNSSVSLLRALINQLNKACVVGVASDIQIALESYEKCLRELNNGDCGYYAANSRSLEALLACAPAKGQVPMWGEYGEFALTIGAMTAVVKTSPYFLRHNCFHLEFFAVNEHQRFISETGYKSHFASGTQFGKTVIDASSDILRMLQCAGKMKVPSKVYEFDWYTPDAEIEEACGQVAFNF